MIHEAPRRVLWNATGFGAYSETINEGKNNLATKRRALVAGIGKFTLPLYKHKKESDLADKHREWTTQKHIVITRLAVLMDLGVDVATAILVIFEHNYPGALLLKGAYNIGVETIPQAVTNFLHQQ